MKNNLQESNSEEDEAENQINNLEHKEGKSIQSEQQKEKRNLPAKEMRIVQGSSGTTSDVPSFA